MNLKKKLTLLLTMICFLSLAQKKHSKKGIDKSYPNIYQNPKTPVDVRVNDLLSKMTLEEKIGQMTQICASNITLDGTKKLDLNVDKIRDVILKYHIGSFLSGTGTAQRWIDFIGNIQKVAVKQTRLGIPIIFGMDNVHGSNYVDEGTFLPHNLNLACTFNPNLIREGAKITNIESGSLGHHWNFAPVCDVGKNPYWPRLYETFGEDPYVCGVMASSFAKGVEDCSEIAPYKVAACAKHFIGYSDPKSGWDRTPSEIPMQTIYETFVPPFRAIFDAGVKTVMVNSGELNGEPVHGSKKILTDLLRTQMKFEGVVVTDIKDILKIVEMHGGAVDEKEATLMSINAGIDMYMACNTYNFCEYMKEFVTDGKISENRIDESVRRILKLKFELDLFENPYPSNKTLPQIGSKLHYDKAVEAARQSLVLLQNKNKILPYSTTKNQKVLVAGFSSISKRNITGPWTLEWQGAEESRQPKMMPTFFQALQNEFVGSNVEFVDSAEYQNHPNRKIFEEKSKTADLIILTVGELPYSEFKGNVNEIKLLDKDIDLINVSYASGKKIVLYIIGGRPRLITDILSKVDAVIWAGIPGVGGTQAMAELITGKFNPSGKLAFSYPQFAGHNIPYYHKKSDKSTALFPFGYGQSFSNYVYSKISISDTIITNPNQKILLKATITNNSNRAGMETALWYIQDEVGTLTRPVKQLKKFQKITLVANESKEVSFEINPNEHLWYPDEKGNKILEDGYFTVMIGDQQLRFRLKR